MGVVSCADCARAGPAWWHVQVVPVDLNAYLYDMERNIASFAEASAFLQGV